METERVTESDGAMETERERDVQVDPFVNVKLPFFCLFTMLAHILHIVNKAYQQYL